MTLEIPPKPITTSARFISNHANQCLEAAKDSPRVPDPLKRCIDQLQAQRVCARLRPWFETCDDKLEGAIPCVNDTLSVAATAFKPYMQAGQASYAEHHGDIKKAVAAVRDKLAEHPLVEHVASTTRPLRESVVSAYDEGGVGKVVTDVAVPGVISVKNRVCEELSSRENDQGLFGIGSTSDDDHEGSDGELCIAK